ncbi:hypothetical protein B0T20DRAFT_367852 [Sordaria brevicollis]|uniref:C2H2-type domain-containing protein n=1 Tax=Sordaria brevicollis TaxID=83679 RepID=A0AAE0PNF8_SORBR|nr:hypothetical protein B0T20DRAFT_367852 [Sordaria brevicollis]
MSGVGLEVLLEGLIPEIAYSGEKGVSVSALLKIVRQYHNTLDARQDATSGEDIAAVAAQITQKDEEKLDESSFSPAEMVSARWAWDWLRTRPQILINKNKRYNKLELQEVLALPEAVESNVTESHGQAGNLPEESAPKAKQPASKPSKAAASQKKASKSRTKKVALTVRPRIYPAEDLVWQTLTRHGVDYKRVPVLEWKCLLGIASVRDKGILQSDLRRLVDQDKRSLPKRTDSLARKGYIAKRTIVVSKMKTSKLWLIDFAPPILETETGGLDLSVETLTKDLEPVTWHDRWTKDNIDMEAFARTFVGVVKAWQVIRYADLRSKMGVVGKHWQMKTLAKNCQRIVDLGVLKYTAATFPGARKVFKDCLKFIRDPTDEEWEKFLATGKKTSLYSDATRHREPKPNALALFGKASKADEAAKNEPKPKQRRIFPGWTPEKPLAQNVFEVIQSAGPAGASNPQVSVATVGYAFRRYMASHLTKVAETQQPPHLKHFQVVSRLERKGKTSAYMFSVVNPPTEDDAQDSPPDATGASAYGFGQVRAKSFPETSDLSLTEICRLAKKPRSMAKRKGRHLSKLEAMSQTEVEASKSPDDVAMTGQPNFEPITPVDQSVNGDEANPEEVATLPKAPSPEPVEERPPGVYRGIPGSLNPNPHTHGRPRKSIVIIFRSDKLKDPSFLATTRASDSPESSILGAAHHPYAVLNATYNGISGKLTVSSVSRAVTFERDSEEAGKEPLAIKLDEMLDDPAVRDVPGAEGKSLVFAAKDNNDGNPAWTFVFVFDDTSENNEKASALQKEIATLKTNQSTSQFVVAEPSTPQSIADDLAPVRGGATRGGRGGRGRGGGGRGRGGRRAQMLAADPKPYKCETCGGAWKNDIGLKYHQTKAQTPCNPNFDPSTVAERGRKRRKLMSPEPDAASVASGAGDNQTAPVGTLPEKDGRKMRKSSARSRATVRAGVRQTAGMTFRGLNTDDVVESVENTAQLSKDQQHGTASGPLSSRVTHVAPKPRFGGIISNFSKETDSLPTPSNSDRAHNPMQIQQLVDAQQTPQRVQPHGHQDGHLSIAGVDERFSSPVDQRKSVPSVQPPAYAEVPYQQSLQAGVSGYASDRASPLPGAAQSSFYPDPSSIQAAYVVPGPHTNQGHQHVASYSSPPQPPRYSQEYNQTLGSQAVDSGYPESYHVNIQHHQQLANQFQAQVAPFVPSKDYSRFSTEAKKRTAQARDIILYLLDNNHGVFPGGKSLFYALTKVYLRAFRHQSPPTWKNHQAAIKALETRHLAMLHTHMLRTEAGRFIELSLILKTGVRTNDPMPMKVKKRMKEKYPSLYIPTAFSPTQEELATLEELYEKPAGNGKEERKVNANGQKFRSRRKIDEVEVFNAPFYTQHNEEKVRDSTDPLWVLESEKASSYKRPAMDELPDGHPEKRARLDEQGTTSRRTGIDDDDSDGSLWEPDHPSPYHAVPRRRGRPAKLYAPTYTRHVPELDENIEPPSVIEAIKAYGLLPAKYGSKKKEAALRKLHKLPPQVGKIRNPGLGSLPPWFFDSRQRPVEKRVVEVQFLEPNLDIQEAGASTRKEQSKQAVKPGGNFTANAGATSTDGKTGGVKRPIEFQFAPCTTIQDESRGSWSSKGWQFFENNNGSFAVKGWMPDLDALTEENLPRSAEAMAKGPGITFNPESWKDPEYGRVTTLIDKCAAWERSSPGTALLTANVVSSKPILINISSSPIKASMKNLTLKWSEDRQFELDTLPYDDIVLVADDESLPFDGGSPDRVFVRPVRATRTMRKPGPNKPGRKGHGGRPPKIKLPAIKTEREHTAYPTTDNDFLRVFGDRSLELDWSSDNVKVTAFVVVTTLLGGVDRVVDWGLMMRIFPDMTLSQLRHTWGALKKDRMSSIVNLTDKFRRAFLKAYGVEVPKINFDNVLEYDWKWLIKWASNLEEFRHSDLPGSKDALKRDYNVTGIGIEDREWRETYNHPQRSVFNKFQDATSEAIALSIDEDDSKVQNDIRRRELALAMAFMRSLCVTPVETYSKEHISKKRNSLFPTLSRAEVEGLMVKGVDQLQREGIISKSNSRFQNGWRWRIANRITDLLDKVAHEERLTQALAYKRELDQAFRAGEKKRVTYVTNDGMIMALLNMQANQRVRIETTGQPHVPMGFEPGNYETRKYTKKYLHFRIDVTPTETYRYDDDVELVDFRKRVMSALPPTVGPDGATPIWCDVFGRVDATRWLRYLCVVLVTIASKGAMGPEELCKTLKPAIMPFEAELIIRWAEELGILGQQYEGTALTVMEWWWIVLDAQRHALESGLAGADVAEGMRTRKMFPGMKQF